MQIETLKVYCDVISHHSFSQAAGANGITQSTASQCVQRLEEHMGTALIDRSVRPWKATTEGHRCFELSRDVVESYHRLEREMRAGAAELVPEIRVGAIYSVGFSYMPELKDAFCMAHPGDRLHVEYLNPNVITARLLDDELDLGIISFPEGHRGVHVIPWKEEEMVVACGPQHPLAQHESIAVGELDGQDFACFDLELSVGRKVEQFLRGHGVHREVVLRFDNIEAIKRAVEDNRTVAILPRPTLDKEVRTGTLGAIAFSDGRLVRPLGLVTRKGRCITPSMQRFVDLLDRPTVVAA